MSKIREAFTDRKVFIPFLTAGDPNLEKTAEYIQELEQAGARYLAADAGELERIVLNGCKE